MVNINIMAKGDRVLFLNEQILAVERKNGTVDVFRLADCEKFIVDPLKIASIGYGNGTVKITDEDSRDEEGGKTGSVVYF